MLVGTCSRERYESWKRKSTVKGKEAVRAERNVIGTRKLSCVFKLEGCFVLEHEAVMRTREKKRERKSGRVSTRHVTVGASKQNDASRSGRGTEGILLQQTS